MKQATKGVIRGEPALHQCDRGLEEWKVLLPKRVRMGLKRGEKWRVLTRCLMMNRTKRRGLYVDKFGDCHKKNA